MSARAPDRPVLACVKPEPGGGAVVRDAIAIASALGRPLRVLSLVPRARGAAGLRAVHEDLATIAAKAREAHAPIDVTIDVAPLVGPAEAAIVARASESAAWLIVVGHRRRTTKQRIHERGTTTALATTSDVPLLIVPYSPGG